MMELSRDTAEIGRWLDAYAVRCPGWDVAAESPEDDAGVPPDMQLGTVDEDGWVAWRVLPSTLIEGDLVALKTEFDVRFPTLFRAYLLARFHMFSQVHSRRYNQLIFMTDTPSNRPLAPLRELLNGWQPLIGAEYIPFAQWGDGWGPMCFDAHNAADGEAPVVWMDHEELIPLGSERLQLRAAVLPFARPLYASAREFLVDVFVEA